MKNVVFDVGGVLLDWNPGRILEGYYADPAERAAMKQAIFLHADWLELDRGTLSEPALLARIGERARRPVPPPQPAQRQLCRQRAWQAPQQGWRTISKLAWQTRKQVFWMGSEQHSL